MAHSERPTEATHGVREHSDPVSGPDAGNGVAPLQAAVVAGGKAVPTEEEVRNAYDVIARARVAGVKGVAAAKPAGGTARIMLGDTGMSRVDFIRNKWTDERMARGAILKLVQAFPGQEKCTYQIIFSATKGLEGGPLPAAPAQPVAPAPAPAQPAAPVATA
jgi:hypothetical protein